MPPALESRLRRYLSSRHYRKNDLGLLFVNRRGRPYSANKLREKKLRPPLAKLRIPLAGFHAFRHAVASELIDSGAPITVVQAQLTVIRASRSGCMGMLFRNRSAMQ
jgi:integrase